LTANALFTPIKGACNCGSIAILDVLYAEEMRKYINTIGFIQD